MSDATVPIWEQRFRATTVGFPAWAEAAQNQLALISNRSGKSQAWAVDRTNGAWRQASDEPVGVEAVHVAPDGRLVWWRDETGDERGHWVAVPFDGGDPAALLPDVPDGWQSGLSMVAGRVAVGVVDEQAYRVWVGAHGEDSRLMSEHALPAGVGAEWPEGRGGLSSDASLLCVRHSDHGDLLHPALRVLDVSTGAVASELADDRRRLDPVAWSPVVGDQRLAFTSELGPFERPGVWDVRTGTRTDLELDLPGAVFPIAWFADATALLVRQEHEGLERLHRVELPSGATTLVADPRGEIAAAAVRPDGSIWLQTSTSARPPRIVDGDGTEVVASPDPPAPGGVAQRSLWLTNPSGDRVQSFVLMPQGEPPFPTIVSVHGGPEWHERERFDVEMQAYVDAGYAVVLVNYRGSTGYGIAFREALVGRVCFAETEDILACVDAVVAEGIADRARIGWSGWSWGGCLGCFNAGVHPEVWKAMFLGIPAGDFVAAHWASAPTLQAWDEAVFGGDPDEVPEAYRRSDPMTYVDRVRAPILVIAGERDSRCPIEGVTPWTEAVRARGAPIDVHLYGTGHHANATDEQVAHMRMVLDFFGRHL